MKWFLLMIVLVVLPSTLTAADPPFTVENKVNPFTVTNKTGPVCVGGVCGVQSVTRERSRSVMVDRATTSLQRDWWFPGKRIIQRLRR